MVVNLSLPFCRVSPQRIRRPRYQSGATSPAAPLSPVQTSPVPPPVAPKPEPVVAAAPKGIVVTLEKKDRGMF